MTLRILVAALAALPAAALSAPAAYPTPGDAAAAVVAALEARDRDALIAVFGPEAEDVILTGDDARDREAWADFLEGWREMNRVAVEADGETATLYLGREQWPFPAPLRKSAEGRWSFDAEAAREEVLLRRIGRNELDVIELMRAYVRVQADYRRTDWDGDGVMEFADAILSAPGARDGLYWPPEPGAPESPIGDFVARASLAGYAVGGEVRAPEPYLGYYFRILTAQGPAAPGGAIEYLLNGNMVAGHALLAVPSAYGETGVMSFLVGEAGVVHEADLGAETLDVAASIDRFDPEARWAAVE
jgi:hypothetical protein